MNDNAASGLRPVNLFLVGTGLIGGALLEQIARQREFLAARHRIRVTLAGVADSRRMMFRAEGIDPATARAVLKAAAGDDDRMPTDLPAFVGRMKAMSLPNPCFCDCTAGNAAPRLYAGVLGQGIPVVTPNKLANSGPLDEYLALTGLSRESGVPYLYETTVCAGLPVISTLRDLFLSGDRVRRVEAVLSGTLSYIFNNFGDGGRTFSALVREAQARGYTEPDPRDDLNAMDAARKALILARECGMALEFSSVDIEPILPPACVEAPNVQKFFGELGRSDAAFEARRAAAAASGKALRYVAVIEDGRASLRLRAEAPASPFRSLIDADNIVVITSDRYDTLPLVIKGPGAGAQVTAGGVFADILRLARPLP